MTSTAAALVEFFLIGVATPLTATCVLPLYPAFVGYLASTSQGEQSRPPALLGAMVVAGVLAFMGLAGVVTVLFLGGSVGIAVRRVSPVAFALMTVVGLLLAVAPGSFSRIPTYEPPHLEYPTASAFGYGLFFGAIVIPCNPATITFFFARATTVLPGLDNGFEAMLGFLVFGLGIGAPLLALAVLSQPFSERLARTLARHSTPINRVVGAFLMLIGLYYLVFIFAVIPGTAGLEAPIKPPTALLGP